MGGEEECLGGGWVGCGEEKGGEGRGNMEKREGNKE